MKRNIMLGLAVSVAASLMLSGCGSSNNNSMTTGNNNSMNTNSSTRFDTMVMMGDTLERDNQNKLEWIGSAGSNGTVACDPHPSATTEAADIASAKAHCDALSFAGHDNWRVPTPQEASDFITGMNAVGLTPFYANPACPRIIGTDSNDKAKAVNTHNSQPVGDMTPWATLLMQDSKNFGVKCVRGF